MWTWRMIKGIQKRFGDTDVWIPSVPGINNSIFGKDCICENKTKQRDNQKLVLPRLFLRRDEKKQQQKKKIRWLCDCISIMEINPPIGSV